MNSQLSHLRILVTRPIHQAASLTNRLQELGATTVQLPLIRICSPPSWQEFDHSFQTRHDWIMFASANAVEATMDRLKQTSTPDWITTARIAAIGAKTASVLNHAGFAVDFHPRSFVAESMVAEFPGYPDAVSGIRILWPKGDIGRTYIKDSLEAAGACVTTACCYSTGGPEDPVAAAARLHQLLAGNEIDIVTLTSSETVRSFHRLLTTQSGSFADLQTNVQVAVIGPETARTAEKLIGRVDIQARQYSVDGLIEAILAAAEVSE